MKKEKIKRKKCPECGKLKPANEVYERIDPYSYELCGDKQEYLMCNDCEEDKAMSV